jgi:hypothetical protein
MIKLGNHILDMVGSKRPKIHQRKGTVPNQRQFKQIKVGKVYMSIATKILFFLNYDGN